MAAAAEVSCDVLEKILVGFDVKDIIRFKRVCKSWYSFISSPRFFNAHFNKHAANNNTGRSRRIVADYRISNADNSAIYCKRIHIVGSYNGLVCVSPKDLQLEVTNPSTTQTMKLQSLPCNLTIPMIRLVVCWGFGYDSSVDDDYKVIAGFRNSISEETTLFHVLTLKSNIWKFIGQVNYKCCANKSGILFGGALHWFMTSADKNVIMSVDLSTHECKEIPQPSENEFGYHYSHDHRLGIVEEDEEECLCISSSSSSFSYIKWVMKNNKWELYNYNYNNDERKYEVAHCLIRHPDVDSQNRTSYVYSHDDDGRLVPSDGDYVRASIFVKTLVSPYPQRQLEGKDDAKGNIRKRKRNGRIL